MKAGRIPLVLIAMSTLVCAAFAGPGAAAQSEKETWCPPPGHPERKALLDALRAEVYRIHHLHVVFVVTYLEVGDGWAWIHTLPQSKDGTQHYEDISALMEKMDGAWQVAELACSEEDNPDCLGAPDYFERLRKRHPGAPPGIFPAPEKQTGRRVGS